MKKVLIELDPRQVKALNRLAKSVGKARSELVRDLVFTYVSNPFAVMDAPRCIPSLEETGYRLLRVAPGVFRHVEVDDDGIPIIKEHKTA